MYCFLHQCSYWLWKPIPGARVAGNDCNGYVEAFVKKWIVAKAAQFVRPGVKGRFFSHVPLFNRIGLCYNLSRHNLLYRGVAHMKAWKLVSLLLAIALIVAVVFCVTLNNSQKLASDDIAKVQADLDAAQATIAEKEQALTDALAQSKAALDQAAADKETALTQAAADKDAAVAAATKEWEDKLKAAEEKGAADKDAAVAAAVKDGEAKLAEAVAQAKADMQLTIDETDKKLVAAQAKIDELTLQLAALTPTPSPTPEPTPAPTATAAP